MSADEYTTSARHEINVPAGNVASVSIYTIKSDLVIFYSIVQPKVLCTNEIQYSN